MKDAFQSCTGNIVGYDERRGELLIRAKYEDYNLMDKRQFKQCNVQLIDSRPLSDKQRRCCYSLIHAIADYSGMGSESTKQVLKIKFLADNLQDTADEMFSLSSAPMSLVCAFQKWMIRLIVDWEIPTPFPLLDYVDDMGDYIYACLSAKKCCICGLNADLHHFGDSKVGMGRNRKTIVHEGLEVLPLCREHHIESHELTMREWNEKYHIDKGIKLDKYLCKKYKLKMNVDEIE